MLFRIPHYLYITDKFSDPLEEQAACTCDDFDGYCPVRIETFHMTSRHARAAAMSPNQYTFFRWEISSFLGKHLLLFDNTNEHG